MAKKPTSAKVFVVLMILFSVLFVGTGCSGGFETASELFSRAGSDEGSAGPIDSITPPPVPTEPPDFELGICSRLDFSRIVWPMSLKVHERKAMALALNVTGSYEGGAGWTNLANNFDGQGISLGLNQQNLGQNTLQPMLIDFLRDNAALASTLFARSDLSSLEKMLIAWKGSSSSSFKSSPIAGLVVSEEDLFPNVDVLSSLDEGGDTGAIEISDARSDASVAWAKATVFESDGSTFKSRWRKSLTDVAATAPYRSAQVTEATSLFAIGKAYFSSLGFTELRSLLVMYDFVVQNGGFNEGHLGKFGQFDRSNPHASETERLLALLEIRLVSVRPQFRNDVKARKSTIINGVGRVHGVDRNLEKEYCSELRAPALGVPSPGPA